MRRVTFWPNGGQSQSKSIVENEINLVEITDEGTPGEDRTALHSLDGAEKLALAHIHFGVDLLDVVRAAKGLDERT